MSVYLDTSLVVAVLTAESHSEAAQEWLSRHNAKKLLISQWTNVEVASALQLKLQLDFIDAENFRRARGHWRELMANYFSLIEVDRADYTAAADLYRENSFNLRSGDALHVAIALRLGSTLATLDRRMLGQARALRVPTADIQRTS